MILAAKSKATFRAVAQAMRAPAVRKRAFDGLAHSNIDALTELWVRPALSLPAVAEDLRRFTLSLRTEVTTAAAARLYDFDKPTLIAWSADDVFFAQEDGARLAATIPNARHEVIAGRGPSRWSISPTGSPICCRRSRCAPEALRFATGTPRRNLVGIFAVGLRSRA